MSTAPQKNSEFERFVNDSFAGNRTKAGEALGVSRIHVWRMIRGDRAVTPQMADSIQTMTKGRFQRDRLVWPQKRRAR